MTIADELIERRNHLLLHPENHVRHAPGRGEECLITRGEGCNGRAAFTIRTLSWLNHWFRTHTSALGSASYNDSHPLSETLGRLDEAIRDAKAAGV
jgi:hypothetical protein